MEQGLEVVNTKFEEYRHGHEREHDLERSAIELQNTETLRRLEELNHAHAQSVVDKAQFLTIGVFDAKQDGIVRRVDAMQQLMQERAVDNAALKSEVATLKMIVYGAVTLALIAVAAAILQLVVIKRG